MTSEKSGEPATAPAPKCAYPPCVYRGVSLHPVTQLCDVHQDAADFILYFMTVLAPMVRVTRKPASGLVVPG